VAAFIGMELGDDTESATKWGQRLSSIQQGGDTFQAIIADFLDDVRDRARKDERVKWEAKVKKLEGQQVKTATTNREGQGADSSVTKAGGQGSDPEADRIALLDPATPIEKVREIRARQKAR
jgi:hypothetical protein